MNCQTCNTRRSLRSLRSLSRARLLFGPIFSLASILAVSCCTPRSFCRVAPRNPGIAVPGECPFPSRQRGWIRPDVAQRWTFLVLRPDLMSLPGTFCSHLTRSHRRGSSPLSRVSWAQALPLSWKTHRGNANSYLQCFDCKSVQPLRRSLFYWTSHVSVLEYPR